LAWRLGSCAAILECTSAIGIAIVVRDCAAGGDLSWALDETYSMKLNTSELDDARERRIARFVSGLSSAAAA
jgi:hypothetical protein